MRDEARAYLVMLPLVLAAALLVFRVVVRRDYLRRGRLTGLSTLLEVLVFCMWIAVGWIFVPSTWPLPDVASFVGVIAWILIAAGLSMVFLGMAALGVRRSLGQEVKPLTQSGPYRVTRNPQVVGCGAASIGYAVVSASWFGLGWVLLYAAIAHAMVITEEEHLRKVFGEGYARYCERVPRYVGFRSHRLGATIP